MENHPDLYSPLIRGCWLTTLSRNFIFLLFFSAMSLPLWIFILGKVIKGKKKMHLRIVASLLISLATISAICAERVSHHAWSSEDKKWTPCHRLKSRTRVCSPDGLCPRLGNNEAAFVLLCCCFALWAQLNPNVKWRQERKCKSKIIGSLFMWWHIF